MYGYIKAVDYYLPENNLTNEDLSNIFKELDPEQIKEITGIKNRCIADKDECASDLALRAAQKLILSKGLDKNDIDYIIFCTETPDYILPPSSCILQYKLGIKKECGAIDINQGCSGYVYGLGLAKGLIETGQAKNVLLLTGDTYSKLLNERDRSTRTIFGDAASATLISGKEVKEPYIGPFVYGTDGSKYDKLIVPAGGFRRRVCAETKSLKRYESGNLRNEENLFMNGAEIFAFSIDIVPKAVIKLLEISNINISDIDLFIFHQASKMILNKLRYKLQIPSDKFFISYENYGNTVSSTIPIALSDALKQGIIKPGMRLMLVGFGVGLSWAATIVIWQ